VGAPGSGGHRDGGALGHAARRSNRAERTAAIPGAGHRATRPTLCLRPSRSLSGTTVQAGSDGGGKGGGIAALLFVSALPYRPIPGRRRPGHRKRRLFSWSAPHASDGGTGRPLRQQMKLLADLEVTTKSVERTAEAIGADIVAREH